MEEKKFNFKIIEILGKLQRTMYEEVDRGLDEKKCEEYISLFDEGIYKEFAKLVIEKTEYINHEKFVRDMNHSFDKFLTNIDTDDSFLVFFGTEKFGSENWILSFMWDKIKNSIIVEDIFDKPYDNEEEDGYEHGVYNNKNLIIFDDCSYSGNNICAIVDHVQYFTKSENMKFHIIVPYMSKWAIEQIRSVSSNEIYFYNKYETLFLSDELPENLKKEEQNIMKFFDLENVGSPVYFDHKIANNFGTFPGIYKNGYYMKNGKKLEYGTILKKLPSRKPVEDAEKKFFEITTKFKYTEKCFDKYIELNDIDNSKDSMEYLHIIKDLPKGKSIINDVSEIIPDKLYLGCEISHPKNKYIESKVDYEKLHKMGITHIIDIKNEYKDKTDKFVIKNIFIPDNNFERIDVHLDDAIEFIDKGKKVYVHCLLGKSRSASIAIAYVAYKFKMSFIDAYNYVYKKRNCIDPNISFKFQLMKYIQNRNE